MAYKDFYQDIKNKDFKSLYILYGEERLLIDRLLSSFVNSVLSPLEQEFNYIQLGGADLDYQQAINTVSRLPIMASKQIVKIDGIDFLNNSNWTEEQKQYFVNYHQQSAENITVIICNSIDKRKKIFREVAKHGKLVNFNKLSDQELVKWCIKEAKIRSKKLSQQVAYRLVEGLGYNHKDSKLTLYSVLSIIEKLCSSQSGAEISLEAVEAIVEDNLDSNIFKMVDALFDGNADFCFRQLDALLIAGEAPIKIQFMIHRQLRLLLKVEHLKSVAYSKKSIADKLGLKPFVVNKLDKQLAVWDKTALLAVLVEAENCDLQLKSAMDEQSVLESFIASTLLKREKIKSIR